MSIVAGVNADVWLSAQPSISTSDEACTDSGDHITYSANTHIFWDDNQTMTVQNSPDGSTSWVTVTDYTFLWAVGQIVFNTARVVSTNNHVRIHAGSYFNVTQLTASSKWSLSLKGKSTNTTSFQSAGGWETYTPTTRGATGTIDTWRNDGRLFAELAATEEQVMLQLYVDKTNNLRWQFAARITAVEPSSDAQGMQSQKVTFEAKKDIYYLTT